MTIKTIRILKPQSGYVHNIMNAVIPFLDNSNVSKYSLIWS